MGLIYGNICMILILFLVIYFLVKRNNRFKKSLVIIRRDIENARLQLSEFNDMVKMGAEIEAKRSLILENEPTLIEQILELDKEIARLKSN